MGVEGPASPVLLATRARPDDGSAAAARTSCMEVEGGSWSPAYVSRKMLSWPGSEAALTTSAPARLVRHARRARRKRTHSRGHQ